MKPSRHSLSLWEKVVIGLLIILRPSIQGVADSGGHSTLRLQAVVRSAVKMQWIPPKLPLFSPNPNHPGPRLFQNELDLGHLQFQNNGGATYNLFVQSGQNSALVPIPFSPNQTQIRIPIPAQSQTQSQGRVPASVTPPHYTVSVVAN